MIGPTSKPRPISLAPMTRFSWSMNSAMRASSSGMGEHYAVTCGRAYDPGVRDRGRLRRAGRGPGRGRAGAAGAGGPRAGRGPGPLAAAAQRRRGRARGRVRRGRPRDAGRHRRPPGPGHGPGRHRLRRPRAQRWPRHRPGHRPGRGRPPAGPALRAIRRRGRGGPGGPALLEPGRSVAEVLEGLPSTQRPARPSPPACRCRPASRSGSWPPPSSATPGRASRPARASGSPAATSGSPCGWPSGSRGRPPGRPRPGGQLVGPGGAGRGRGCRAGRRGLPAGRARLGHRPHPLRAALPGWKADALGRVAYGHAAKLFVPLRRVPPPSAVLSVPDHYWTWTAQGADGTVQPVVSAFAGSAPALAALEVTAGPATWRRRLAAPPRPRPRPGRRPLHLGRRPLDRGRLLHPHPRLPSRRPRPARPPRRPLHFAGEHTAGPWSGLMEGALRSGHRAAADLFDAHGLGRLHERT